jgi:hypothetical protein
MGQDLEQLVTTYLAIRNERERIKLEYESQDSSLKDELSVLEMAMLEICNTTKADSIKTQNGTVIRKLTERFYCNDWDNFKDFVLQHKAVELLERRIHQGNFKEFMVEHEQDGLPPGVNVMREYGIVVRKPAS